MFLFHSCSNSLLEEDVTSADNPSGSTQYVPKSNYGIIPADNMFKDSMLEPQCIPINSRSMGSSKYLQTHAFSPSMDWENGEVSSTCPLEKVRLHGSNCDYVSYDVK